MGESRMGKRPVPVPKGVEVTIQGTHVRVKGPKGTLEREFVGVEFEQRDGTIYVRPTLAGRRAKAFHGLGRALLANMVEGVSKGFERVLEVHGTGWRAELKGRTLELSLGFSHPALFALPEGVEASVEERQGVIRLRSVDKELLGQTAAKLRALRPPDSYKGKGVRYAGEVLSLKPTKATNK